VRFLADESCDFRVVTALRNAGHDVVAVAEVARGALDQAVLVRAQEERRVILAEDKDFGQLTVATQRGTGPGLLLMRCPEPARAELPAAIVSLVARLGDRLIGAIVVWTPRRTRYRAI